jgi:hypothetical protein
MRALIIAVCCLWTSASGAQDEIHLTCYFERSVDSEGKSGPTSGEMSVIVTFMLPIGKPKNILIKTSKAPCYEFLGDASDLRIEGTCDRFIQLKSPMKYMQELTIDRVNGRFEQMIQLGENGGALVHHGRCSSVKKMF